VFLESRQQNVKLFLRGPLVAKAKIVRDAGKGKTMPLQAAAVQRSGGGQIA
jgi:hypothetical protein